MKLLKKTVLFFLLILFILYLSFVFLLPKYLNSPKFSEDINDFLYKNFKLHYKAEGFGFSTTFSLKIVLKANKISLYKDFDSDGEIENEEKLFYTENLYLSTGTIRQKSVKVNADYLLFNSEYLNEILPSKKKNIKKNSNGYDFFAQIDIKKAKLIFSNDKAEKFVFDISDFLIKKEHQKSIITFNADVSSPLLKHSVKIGNEGGLEIVKRSLNADNLSVMFGETNVKLNGLIQNNNGKTNFSMTGTNIPVDDLEASVLYFLKLRKKDKVFIENFYNWGGVIDADLKFTNEGIFGKCKADNLSAKSVLFNVPIVFKEAEFIFEGREVKSLAFGTIGFDKVVSDFSFTNMATPEQTVEGSVQSNLKNETVSKYLPKTSVKGSALTTVKYHVKNHQIHVDYSVKINKGSNLYYNNNINLGLENKSRILVVNTYKHDDVLEITSYKYSMSDLNGDDVILTGTGLFKKKNKKLTLEYIIAKTDGFAPVEVTGSFGNYLNGGEFEGDLKYTYNTKQITGTFNVINTRYKRFHVEKADFKADKNKMEINANGTFKDEIFNCSTELKNNFQNRNLHIYNMDLFLDKYYMKDRPKNRPKDKTPLKNMKKINRKIQETHLTIDNWKIRINKIIKDRIALENIIVQGNLKNDLFKFKTSDMLFAQGTMDAEGFYNLKTHSSVVDYNAKNINSAIVAENVFGLKNQVEGLASAKIHSEAQNARREIFAHADFKIKKGSLPQLGNREFYLKQASHKHPWKVSLQKALNVNVTKEALTSDLEGSFDLENTKLKNIKLTSKQKYFAFAITGDYNIENKSVDLMLFGKYNKTKGKTIKIYHIPLSWIIRFVLRPETSQHSYKKELKQVPPIQANKNEEGAFKVKIQGNITSTDDMKVEMKQINTEL